MMKLPTFDNLFSPLYDIPLKLVVEWRQMTTAVAFSRQNDAGSPANTTEYWENHVPRRSESNKNF